MVFCKFLSSVTDPPPVRHRTGGSFCKWGRKWPERAMKASGEKTATSCQGHRRGTRRYVKLVQNICQMAMDGVIAYK
jgi:hypothetical protein